MRPTTTFATGSARTVPSTVQGDETLLGDVVGGSIGDPQNADFQNTKQWKFHGFTDETQMRDKYPLVTAHGNGESTVC